MRSIESVYFMIKLLPLIPLQLQVTVSESVYNINLLPPPQEKATLFCVKCGLLFGVMCCYHLFTNTIIFYQLSCIIFFCVHTNDFCYLSKK